jgi:hypothetical protein
VFAGSGQAWFDVQAIQNFGRTLDSYPILQDKPPTLRGGYWRSDGSSLEQEHLFVSVSPAGKTGALVVQVRLATPSPDLSAPSQRVEVVLSSDYGSMQRFARDVQRLALGEVNEAILDANAAR